MSLRPLVAGCLWVALASGALAMPAAVVIGSEDGPTPAVQLWRRQALAKRVLLGGGGVATLAACALYGISRSDRRRASSEAADPKPRR